MTVTISGSGTIGGITSGGLGGNPIITQPELAANVVGNGPAFSAYQTGTPQIMGANTWTKVIINTEEFDTNSNFDTGTYRFTPTVAGYYQVNATMQFTTAFVNGASIYKNGTLFKAGTIVSSGQASEVSALIYMNGSTDYVEFYTYTNTTATANTGPEQTYFQAAMVRAA